MAIDLQALPRDPLGHRSPLLALPVFQDDEELPPLLARVDEVLGGAFSRAREAGDFRGRTDDALLLYLSAEEGPARVVFLGAGKREDVDMETFRALGGRAVREAEVRSLTSLTVHLPDAPEGGPEDPVQAAAEGAGLAAWDFRELKSERDEDDEDAPRPLVTRVDIHSETSDPSRMEASLQVARAFVQGESLARDLQWRPGNVATPTHLAEVARELARELSLEARILGPRELAEEGMTALLAVAAGSEEEPRLIVLEYRGGKEGEAPLALVGKGLTFDAGGISIKPAKGMEKMKYDMSGGAAVLGAMKGAAVMGLPVNLVGVVPSTENLLSGKATKPGDVIQTRAGITVEVINTDAEGRLILADALSYTVDHHRPSAMVDCATLTGAAVVALGHHAAPLLGNDEGLISELREAGDRSGERCWPLPLWRPYKKQLESPVADLKNVGGRPAGAITAAWFLAHFVGESSWAHLDVAGTAYGESRAAYQREGGHGFPTRLLLEWVRGRSR